MCNILHLRPTSQRLEFPTLPQRHTLRRLIIIATFLGAFGLFGLKGAFGLDFNQLQQILISRFGSGSGAIFSEWQEILSEGKKASESDKLRRVNDFFNQRIYFNDDINIWGQSDYWATPLETIGRAQGDCEDFSIAKYYSLIDLGIPVSKLRLVYVKATQRGPLGSIQQAHMVLAYYSTPNADPLVLDNLNTQILPASRRSDLFPIFSFNSAGLWQGTGQQSSKSNLSRWQDLLTRARAEGFQ